MRKKVLAVLMIAAMLLCFMPSTAFAEGPVDADSGVVFTKTASQTNDGNVEITLKAYTTSTTVTSISSRPVDIVLVLDQSGSMKESFGKGSRQEAMKSAVKKFIDNIDPNGGHRVSVVTFGSDASKLADWTSADEAGKASLLSKIDKLPKEPQGATNVAAGMNTANSLLNSANEESQKVVIVFTDGVPTEYRDFDTGVADEAIATAKTMKYAGVKVYTIGIFNGADPKELNGDKYDRAVIGDIDCDGSEGSYWGNTTVKEIFGYDVRNIDVPAGNRFLNYLSNNFKEATEIGITNKYDFKGLWGGDGWYITKNFDRSDSKYYRTASDAAGLSDVFEKIQSETMVPAIELDASTVISDGISSFFNAPAATGIKVYTADFGGSEFNEANLTDITGKVSISVTEDKKVEVSGFNFNDNYISSTPRTVNGKDFYGKELIIKFTVAPDYTAIDNALGNGTLVKDTASTDYKVPTNTDAQILKGTEVVAAADGRSASMHTVTYQVAGENAPRKVQLRAAGAQVKKEADLTGYSEWTSNQIAATDINTSGYFTMPNTDVVFTCEADNTPVIPKNPVATDIDGLSGKVQVECETNTAGHKEALYNLTDFSISEVQGTEGNYYVTLTVPAAPYVAEYVKTYGDHTQVATDPASKELIASYDGQGWSIAATSKAVFHVECAVTPQPVIPKKPVATDIDGLSGKVQVECETNTAGHKEALYNLTDFSISEVQGTEGNYYVTLTVPAAPYVAEYVKTYGDHTQVATDPASKELIASYDGQGWSIAAADKVVFHVECVTSDPDPVTPPTHYYTVKWNNYDNTNLETDYCTYYQMPTYDSATPVKPEDDQYIYEFIGWDKEVVRVTGDAVYTAQFKAIAKDITDPDNGGSGNTPAGPDQPSKPSKPDANAGAGQNAGGQNTGAQDGQNSSVPKTEDGQNMMFWLLLMAAALAGAGVTYRLAGKQK